MVHYESCPYVCYFPSQDKSSMEFFLITKCWANFLTFLSFLFSVSNQQPFFRMKSLIIVPGLGDVDFWTVCGLINNVVGKSVS